MYILLYQEEIKKLLDIGVNPSKIIYAHTCKQPSMLRYATEQGVSLMTFDNEAELFKIKTLCPDAKFVYKIVFLYSMKMFK